MNGEGGQHDGENGEGDEEGGRGRRVPPVANNSVYIKGFPETTSEDDIRAEVCCVHFFFFSLRGLWVGHDPLMCATWLLMSLCEGVG